MAAATVLGMPLVERENDPVATDQPVAAVVVVKTISAEHGVGYLVRATEGLMTVEALGMARFAQLQLEDSLINPAEAH